MANTNSIYVAIQSFEEQALRDFATLSDLPLIQNMWFANPKFTYDLAIISSYAAGVSPQLKQLVDDPLSPSVIYDTDYSDFIRDAHV